MTRYNFPPGFPQADADRLEQLLAILDRRDLTESELNECQRLENGLKRAQAQHDRRIVTEPLHVGAPRGADDVTSAAFVNYLRTGRESSDLASLRNEQGEGTGSTGGYLVPDGFRTKLVDRLKAYGGVAKLAEEVTTTTGNNLPWPTIDDTANVGEIVAEHGTFSSGADFVFGEASLGAYRYAAGGSSSTPIRISVELLQDSAINVEQLVARKLAERIGRVQATHLVSGNRVAQPQGIAYGLTGIELAANSAVTLDDLIGFVHSVDPAYRDAPGCGWIFNDSSLEAIRKLKDADSNPLWRPSLNDPGVMSVSGSLLGFPVYVDQAFPDISLTSNTVNWGVFGNIRAGYVIRRVRDVVIAVNPYSRMANGQVEYSAWARMDAVQQDTNAYVALTGHNG